MNNLLRTFTKHPSHKTDGTEVKDEIKYEESLGTIVSIEDSSEDEEYLISAFEMKDAEL